MGEGTDTDYMVSDLFASDFKFNRFDDTEALIPGTDEKRVSNPLYAPSDFNSERFHITEAPLPGTVEARISNPLYASRRRLDERVTGLKSDWLAFVSEVAKPY